MAKCDVCGEDFTPGEIYAYHQRLNAQFHFPFDGKKNCSKNVQGEDVSSHTLFFRTENG